MRTDPDLALKDWGGVVEKYSMLLFSPQVAGLLAAGLRSLLVAAAATPQAEHVSWEEASVPRAQPLQGELQLLRPHCKRARTSLAGRCHHGGLSPPHPG